jgi:tRNA-specific 2-thiouridylase
MSGGVDSAVAAARCVADGHDVIGLSLRLARDGTGGCCSLDDFADARAVADRLGIPHYVFDFRDAFERAVVQPFVAEYLAGRTPNLCALCNQHVKFDLLWRRARELEPSASRPGTTPVSPRTRSPACRLRTAIDAAKDQTYFLFALGQVARPHALPGRRSHQERGGAQARALGLAVADKPESMEVLRPGRRRGGVRRAARGTRRAPAGRVVDADGRGLACTTVCTAHGRPRRGLGIGGGPRRYVRDRRQDRNRHRRWPRGHDGARPHHARDHLDRHVPPRPAPASPCASGIATARSRRSRPSPATGRPFVSPDPGRWHLGVKAVFYRGDVVVGGG